MTRERTFIVDADTHVNEPPDLWTSRLPSEFRERSPRVVSGDGGHAWTFDGRKAAVSRLINVAGVSPSQWTLLAKEGYREFRPGGWEAEARLKDMDADQVDVHVLFPSYAWFVSAGTAHDREFHLACHRAYNDWLSGLCGVAPERLVGVALLPRTGVDDALAELNRVRALPGIRSVNLSTWPSGRRAPTEADERFWSALEDLDVPLAIHIGFGLVGEERGEAAGADDDTFKRLASSLPVAAEEHFAVGLIPVVNHFILGGILERHPRLRVAFVESGIGWVPFFLEQAEQMFLCHRFWTGAKLSMLPSEYWARNCFATFQWDVYGIRNRDLMGSHTIMWSSDYPHSGSLWPNSKSNALAQLRDVPADDQALILSANACRFYGIASARRARGAEAA